MGNQSGEEKHMNLKHQTCENVDEVSANQIIKDKIIYTEIYKKEEIENNGKDIIHIYKDIQDN